MQDTIIYTHGIAALVAAGVIKANENEIMDYVDNATDSFLMKARA